MWRNLQPRRRRRREERGSRTPIRESPGGEIPIDRNSRRSGGEGPIVRTSRRSGQGGASLIGELGARPDAAAKKLIDEFGTSGVGNIVTEILVASLERFLWIFLPP